MATLREASNTSSTTIRLKSFQPIHIMWLVKLVPLKPSLFSCIILNIVDDILLMSTPKRSKLDRIKKYPMALPKKLVGTISPYPTEVKVTTIYQTASPNEWMLLPFLLFSATTSIISSRKNSNSTNPPPKIYFLILLSRFTV